jgi:hypothetical protein
MEEPTTAEMVRTLMAQLSALAASTARIEGALAQHVTQEQRTADKELASVRETQQNEKIAALDARATFIGRAIWTVVLGPLFVGILVWLITRGGA